MEALENLDLSDRGTQIMLAGGAIVAGLLVARLRGGPAGDEGPEVGRFVIESHGQSSGPPYVGTFPPSPPIYRDPPDPADPDPDPADPDPDPDPADPDPVDPTPDPSGWQWVDPTGKPYSCPTGSRMAFEKGGTGNHVCVALDTGRAFPVTLDSTGKPWTPDDDPKPAPGGGGGQKPYYCEAPSVLAKESNGSGNDVCRWPNGRETRVIMRSTNLPYGVGGDVDVQGEVSGLPFLDGSAVLPAMITSRDHHTVGPNESLVSIAARYLGAAERWPALLDANPELRGMSQLRSGMTIRLP